MAVLEALRSIVGATHVLSDARDCAPYERDWRGRYQGQAIAVVRPANASQVADVLAVCAAYSVAVVPQGGNTGLVGGGVPREGGRELLLSLSRLNRVRDCDPLNNTITVEAGVTLAALQAAAMLMATVSSTSRFRSIA